MKKKTTIVRHSLDDALNKPLSSAQKKQLEALKAMPDDEIDYSDIPPLTEDFFKHAVRGKFYKPVKKPVTIRLDADMLEWYKSLGGKYQSRINEVLRNHYLSECKEG